MGKYFFVALIGSLVTLGINNVVAKDSKIKNAASQDDVKEAKTEMCAYADGIKVENKEYVNAKFTAHERRHDSDNLRDDMVIDMVKELYKAQFNRAYVHKINED